MSDGRIHVASDRFAFVVFPDVGAEAFRLECEDPKVQATVSERLLDRSWRHEVYAQPTLAMELQSWVEDMIENRDVFMHMDFEPQGDTGLHQLLSLARLAPETLLPRGSGYEQYASKRALEGSGMSLIGEPREWYSVIPTEQVLHLTWPLPEPSSTIAPARAARKVGDGADRYANRMLLNARAAAERNDTFLSLAHARAGAFADALDQEKLTDALVSDALFDPVEEDVTEYFRVDRLIRSRRAACRVRAYVMAVFNEQLLGRWAALNSWPQLGLHPRRTFWTAHDWANLHDDYRRGNAQLADVVAAVRVEWEHQSWE